MTGGGLITRLRPHSYRTRITLSVLSLLALMILVGQLVFQTFVAAQIRDTVSHTLDIQARELARIVAQGGNARDFGPFLTGTRIYVLDGQRINYYNLAPHREVKAVAHNGQVTVTLERDARTSVLARWVLPTLIALGAGIMAAAVWLISGGIARRLRHSAGELADVAQRIAGGDRTARAEEHDDELGRVAASMNQMAANLESGEMRQREFLADAAHELRTPVTAIEGFAEALVDGTARTEEDRQEAAIFIRDEATRLRVLVRELQEMTWLDLDPPVAWQRVDLAAIGRTVAARFEVRARDAGITLRPPDGEVVATSDPDHIATILENLISNAIRATPDGGRVEIRAGTDIGGAWLRVDDTGCGIAQEHLPYLFDRLFRVHSSRDRAAGGTGLGLAIVKRLVQRIGGKISVQSAPGEGATFTVRLPAIRATGRRGRTTMNVSEQAPGTLQ